MENISHRVGYTWVLLVGIICAWLVYQSGMAYYNTKIQQYTAEGEAAWTLRSAAIQQRIGTGHSIR